jgi:hypothetical protein
LAVICAFWFAHRRERSRWFGLMMAAIRNRGKSEWVNYQKGGF